MPEHSDKCISSGVVRIGNRPLEMEKLRLREDL